MSKRISQQSVLLSILAAGATFGALTAPAMAQDQTAAPNTIKPAPRPATQSTGLTEVIVTAQKRDTNLQKTPIAISVMHNSDLLNQHIQSLADITGGTIPSLSVEPFFARGSALIVSTRGIGAMSDANQPNRDQGVGVYEDGVYLGRAQGLGTAMDDIDQIEVARGPEGTLFGRNTEGGAISIVTKKPTGVFDMNTTVGVSNFGGEQFQTHIDLPSFDDISAKIDVLDTSRGGTVKNPLAGQQNFNAYDKHGARVALRWRLRDDLDINYAYDTSFDATTPYYVQLLTKGSYPMSPLAAIQPDRATVANFGVPQQYSEGRTSGHLLTVDWTLSDDLKFKSISSFRTLSQTQYDDGETNLFAYVLSPAPTGAWGRYSLANFWQTQASQEFQLIGKSEHLTYIGGLFYYTENVHDNAWTPSPLEWDGSPVAYSALPVAYDASPFPDRASHAHDQSLGAYAQATWTPDFANKIMHFTFGGRLSQDHKMGDLDLVNGALPVVVSENGTLVTGVITMDKTWSRFDPLVIASVTPTPDIDLYAKWDTGSKAGGANSRSLTYRTFNPESVSMAEIGAKTEFFDHHLRFNVDGFSGDYKDPQIDFNADFDVGGSNRATIETVNATGMGHTSGYEGDLTALITRNLTVSASIAKTDITMPQAANPFAGNVLTAVYALNTPRSAHNFAIDYHHPWVGMQLRAHLDANISDGLHGSSADPTLSDKSAVVNGRLALSDIAVGSNGAKLQISLWSRNLGNEQHTFYKASSTLGQYGIFNEPRTYGLEVNVKY